MDLSSTNSFYVTLLSGSSLEYYPENTLSKFTVKLPYDLHFTNNINNEKEAWYVGITRFVRPSIQIHPRRIYLAKRDSGKKYIGITDILVNIADILEDIKDENFFNEYLNSSTQSNKPSLSIVKDISNNEYIEIRESGHFNIKVPLMDKFSSRELFDLIFSKISTPLWQKAVLYFKKTLENNLLNESKALNNLAFKQYIFDTNPNYICFYSDIISPRIFGNNLTRALHMEAVTNVDNLETRNSVDIKNIEYCRIEKTHISEINILIADENGEQINFSAGSFNTLITLHFRKGI